MSDFSANLLFSPCMHRHVVVVITGSRRFSQGEVTDDIQERLQCLDCLEYVTEAEVHAAWDGVNIEEIAALQVEDDLERLEVKE